jgi:hypothetical protein
VAARVGSLVSGSDDAGDAAVSEVSDMGSTRPIENRKNEMGTIPRAIEALVGWASMRQSIAESERRRKDADDDEKQHFENTERSEMTFLN